ncbi:MAG TPA: enoyl-CoA hydratase/isomerase family protein [Vicinamibacterales bacterium]|nr:enoyl-CoA hydratase/isomerase family protein [Vicinamibacterales bacterium]
MRVQIRAGHRVSAQILFSRHDAVGLITLNRPEVLNAFADQMREELVDVVRAAAEDTAIRAVVITGAGRGFCAGADVRRMYELVCREEWDTLEALVEGGASVVKTIDGLGKPVLAAVNGAAAGGGANLALACDIRIAGTSASIGQTFSRVGLQPDWGGTYFLPRLVGLGRALELAFTGEILSAPDALRLGIFNRVVGDGEVVNETIALAARIAVKSPLAVALAKQSIRQSYGETLDDALHTERVNQLRLFKTAEARDAMRAFVVRKSHES